MTKTKVVLNVYGGCVQDVCCSDPAVEVVLVDWDHKTDDCDPADCGLAEGRTPCGQKRFAYVADYPTSPLRDLTGTDVLAALTSAGMDPSVFVRAARAAVEPQGNSAPVPSYRLTLDGPLFRRQRELLARLRGLVTSQQPYEPATDDVERLDGLIELTDELAHQAHDNHGVDCLLEPDEDRCECESPGFFHSGVPGILAHMENGRLAEGAKAERCDLCKRYPSDEAALEQLRELGLA